MSRPTPLVILAGLFAVACDGEIPTVPESAVTQPPAIALEVATPAEINQDLAALRQLTAPFHNFDMAAAAGYDTDITGCVEQLPDGAQGHHYANLALIGDGTTGMLEPEILQYEPKVGGGFRLVGVEYIVLLGNPQPADLFGQQFHANEAAGVWALHVWLWRQNPGGMFEDWNPKVSC